VSQHRKWDASYPTGPDEPGGPIVRERIALAVLMMAGTIALALVAERVRRIGLSDGARG
jgi:hypothetical protein